MIIQFRDGKLTTEYKGPSPAAKDIDYYYQAGKHELDIAKAHRQSGSVSTNDVKRRRTRHLIRLISDLATSKTYLSIGPLFPSIYCAVCR